ncbi:MAG: hypothetical protein IPO30_00145 [Hyphomonadaceae bacterium]|nr:hypothetical protein [Hyphomonadaceae bacterium]
MRFTIAAFAIAMLAPAARAQDITGDWTGKYICAQGVTALSLTIQKANAPGAVVATFAFGPLPENPDVPEGAYRMRGKYDPMSRRLELSGERWINQPSGYVMVGLDGAMNSTGQKIAGHVPGLFTCTDFEVWRPAQLVG